MKAKKLHLGCGKDIRDGFVNVDSAKLPGVDKVYDLNKYPWPFKESEFSYVYADNVLEHLNSIVEPMEEIWRVTKNGSISHIIVPIVPSVWAFIDPTHKQFYTPYTFDYFTSSSGLGEYYSKARFKIRKREFVFHPLQGFMKFVNIHPRFQRFFYLFFAQLIPPRFVKIELETVK